MTNDYLSAAIGFLKHGRIIFVIKDEVRFFINKKLHDKLKKNNNN